MSRKIKTFTSLHQFLVGARQAFNRAVEKNAPVKLVVGNESADLDSFASSVLYAFLDTMVQAPEAPKTLLPKTPEQEIDAFFSRLPVPTLPILSIPRNEVNLRPEHAYLTSQLSFDLSDVPTLSDIPPYLNPTTTSLVLVDHNVLQPPLAPRFSKVTSIIDHHVDEKQYLSAVPRKIHPVGSCTSLVANHFLENSATHWNALPAPIHSEIARLALAPILADTANMKAESKITPYDLVQVTEFLDRVGEDFDRNAFYDALQAAKRDLDSLSVDGLLRKDYKQWEETSGVTLGVSAITRSLSWVVKKAGGVEKFAAEVQQYAKEKKLDVAIVMTTDSSSKNSFRRDLMIWGLNDRTRNFVKMFEDQANDKFELGQWPDKEDELEEEVNVDGMKAWTQASLDLSRKQVAPVLRDIASKL